MYQQTYLRNFTFAPVKNGALLEKTNTKDPVQPTEIQVWLCFQYKVDYKFNAIWNHNSEGICYRRVNNQSGKIFSIWLLKSVKYF